MISSLSLSFYCLHKVGFLPESRPFFIDLGKDQKHDGILAWFFTKNGTKVQCYYTALLEELTRSKTEETTKSRKAGKERNIFSYFCI